MPRLCCVVSVITFLSRPISPFDWIRLDSNRGILAGTASYLHGSQVGQALNTPPFSKPYFPPTHTNDDWGIWGQVIFLDHRESILSLCH